MMTRFKDLFHFFGRTEVSFYTFLWLAVLVTLGTLAQADMGLYAAQQKYFSSFFFSFYGVPLPGAYPTLGVCFLGLLSKLVAGTQWRNQKKLGTIVVHIGVLLLLFGGFLTAAFSEEGNMVIPEGETTNVLSHYHDVELAVINHSNKDQDSVVAFQEGWLEKGKILKDSDLPYQLKVLEYYTNCAVIRRGKKSEAPAHYKGFSKNFIVTEIPNSKESESNRSCLLFEVTGAEEVDGVYAIYEFMSIAQTLKFSDQSFSLELRRSQTHLPFSIELVDFVKQTYAATQMAAAYKSVIVLKDGDLNQRKVIQMNEPLRYKGYTFYQSSFMQGSDDSETTVLAVVKNIGRTFPYISSLIMCLGLLLHLMIQIPQLIKGKKS